MVCAHYDLRNDGLPFAPSPEASTRNADICKLLAEKAVVLAANSADIIASEAANRKHLLQDYASYDGENQAAKDRDVDRLVDEEEREEGRVSKEQFSNYLDSLGGMKVYIFLIVVQTLWHVCRIGSDL
ncbi:hypothetical protein KRP22_005214 [Phytophthora ramorum]|nr:hypothetical protein KRP22_12798 [Phytophthora ramorum]